jgi:hypothetical protein
VQELVQQRYDYRDRVKTDTGCHINFHTQLHK